MMRSKNHIKHYYQGLREGITRYSYWKDGVQYVGTCGETLKDAILRINTEEEDLLDYAEDRREIDREPGFSRVGLILNEDKTMYKLIGSAQGLKGLLCKSYGGDGDFLRVYQPEDTNNSVDYYIHHPDIEIEILDDSAYMYQAPNGEYIIDISFEGMDIDGKKERWVVHSTINGTYLVDSYSKEEEISIKVEDIFKDIEEEIKYAQELAAKLNSLE